MATKPKRPIDDRLLDTAIDQFGRKGLEGASTRAIAAAARTAMSSITYHYGGKDGLHIAAARHIGQQIGARMAAALGGQPNPSDLSPEAAVDAVLGMVDGFLGLMLAPESAPWARFIVREQLEPTKAFTILWEQFMKPLSGRLVALTERAGAGRWDAQESRLRALTMIGQLLVFRVARATALAMTQWDDIGATEAAAIRRVAHANVRAILSAGKSS
ncbi:MAG: CerR family C-terminal domain-containing protein [Proteobacteria bacterium]|nr:CerR family C-terminal domain-containing protein [Pseudomonadota bacterium]